MRNLDFHSTSEHIGSLMPRAATEGHLPHRPYSAARRCGVRCCVNGAVAMASSRRAVSRSVGRQQLRLFKGSRHFFSGSVWRPRVQHALHRARHAFLQFSSKLGCGRVHEVR